MKLIKVSVPAIQIVCNVFIPSTDIKFAKLIYSEPFHGIVVGMLRKFFQLHFNLSPLGGILAGSRLSQAWDPAVFSRHPPFVLQPQDNDTAAQQSVSSENQTAKVVNEATTSKATSGNTPGTVQERHVCCNCNGFFVIYPH